MSAFFVIHICIFLSLFVRVMLCKCGLCHYAVSVCPSVCLSVCHIREFCQNETKFFHHWVAQPFWFFRIKLHGNIPTEPPPPMGVSNTGGVGSNHDSDPISGFTACCQRCDQQVLSTRCCRTMVPQVTNNKRLFLTFCTIEANY